MNFIRALFRRWAATQRPAPLSSVRPFPFTRITLADWRASAERTAYVAELLRTPLFLDLVGMLANVRPPECLALDATSAAIQLGHRVGCDTLIATLLAAGRQDAPAPAPLTANYAAENTMAAWENESDT